MIRNCCFLTKMSLHFNPNLSLSHFRPFSKPDSFWPRNNKQRKELFLKWFFIIIAMSLSLFSSNREVWFNKQISSSRVGETRCYVVNNVYLKMRWFTFYLNYFVHKVTDWWTVKVRNDTIEHFAPFESREYSSNNLRNFGQFWTNFNGVCYPNTTSRFVKFLENENSLESFIVISIKILDKR